MNQWDIYLANVPFEDLPTTKVRPVLVLDNACLIVDCLKMTSHAPRSVEYVLKYWREAGLRKQTTVRISKRLALKPDAFLKRLGTLHIMDRLEIQKRLILK